MELDPVLCFTNIPRISMMCGTLITSGEFPKHGKKKNPNTRKTDKWGQIIKKKPPLFIEQCFKQTKFNMNLLRYIKL